MGAPIRGHGPLLLQIEIDALSQRQVTAPVDRIRLPAHVGFPGIGSCLTATTRFFFAAKCTTDLGARRADVDIRDAAI